MGVHKNFSVELYKQNDAAGVNRVIAYLLEAGTFALRNDDTYGVDIVVCVGFKPTYYVEVEIKQAWKSGPGFPFPTVNLPQRKKKFADLPKPVEFWILSKDMEWAIILPDFAIRNDRLEEVKNRLVPNGEMFYKIPVEECIIKYLGPAKVFPDTADK